VWPDEVNGKGVLCAGLMGEEGKWGDVGIVLEVGDLVEEFVRLLGCVSQQENLIIRFFQQYIEIAA